MKKILILTITLVTLFSCSNDDKNLDPIIGSWYVFSRDGIETDECERKGLLTFEENSNVSSVYYELYDDECKRGDYMNPKSGTWSSKGNGAYSITYRDETKDFILVFSDNNNTFYVSESEDRTIYKRN